MSKAVLDGTFGRTFGVTNLPSSPGGDSPPLRQGSHFQESLATNLGIDPRRSQDSITESVQGGFLSPTVDDAPRNVNLMSPTSQAPGDGTWEPPTPNHHGEVLTFQVQKKLKNLKIVPRSLCVDLQEGSLMNLNPEGELLKQLPLSSILALKRSQSDRTNLTISFDVPGQSNYNVIFDSPSELKRFASSVTPHLALPHAGFSRALSYRFSHQIWREWRENIRRDKTMVKRNDPRVITRLILFLKKLTDVEKDPNNTTAHVEARSRASKWVMHPRSALALLIATFSILFLIYTALVTPFSLAFFWDVNPCDGSPVAEGDMVVDLFFMLEIGITCFTGRYVHGIYVSHLAGILKDYVQCGQIFFDLLTSIPISWIELNQRLGCKPDENGVYKLQETGGSFDAVRALKILKPLRLLRLLRLLKLFNHRVFKIIQERLGVRPDFVRLFKLGFGVIMVAHFAGCLFWSVKVQSNDPLELHEWMHRQHFQGEDWCPYGRVEPREARGLTDCESVALWSAYMISFYFAMTTLTTVGFGDIYGENEIERLYCVVLQLAGTVVFATIMSQLSSVLANLSSKSRAQEDKLETVRRFCSRHNVNNSMTRKCLEWISFKDQITTEEQERLDVLEDLPRGLQAQLALMLHSRLLHAIPILHRTGSDFLAELAMRLRVELKSEGEPLVQFGQWSDTLYIVEQGCLQVQDSLSNLLTILGPGDFVGETQVLRPSKSEVTVVSAGFAQLKALTHRDLLRLARKFPEVNRHFRAISKRPASGISISGCTSIAQLPLQRLGSGGGPDDERGGGAGEGESRVESDGALVNGKVVLRWLLVVSRSLCAYYARDESTRLVNLLVQFARQVTENSAEGGEGQGGEREKKAEWSSSGGSEVAEDDFGEEEEERVPVLSEGEEEERGRGEVEREREGRLPGESKEHAGLERRASLHHSSSGLRLSGMRGLRAMGSARSLRGGEGGGSFRRRGKRELAGLEARMEWLEVQGAQLRQQVGEVQRGVDHLVFMMARQRLEAMKTASIAGAQGARGDEGCGDRCCGCAAAASRGEERETAEGPVRGGAGSNGGGSHGPGRGRATADASAAHGGPGGDAGNSDGLASERRGRRGSGAAAPGQQEPGSRGGEGGSSGLNPPPLSPGHWQTETGPGPGSAAPPASGLRVGEAVALGSRRSSSAPAVAEVAEDYASRTPRALIRENLGAAAALHQTQAGSVQLETRHGNAGPSSSLPVDSDAAGAGDAHARPADSRDSEAFSATLGARGKNGKQLQVEPRQGGHDHHDGAVHRAKPRPPLLAVAPGPTGLVRSSRATGSRRHGLGTHASRRNGGQESLDAPSAAARTQPARDDPEASPNPVLRGQAPLPHWQAPPEHGPGPGRSRRGGAGEAFMPFGTDSQRPETPPHPAVLATRPGLVTVYRDGHHPAAGPAGGTRSRRASGTSSGYGDTGNATPQSRMRGGVVAGLPEIKFGEGRVDLGGPGRL